MRTPSATSTKAKREALALKFKTTMEAKGFRVVRTHFDTTMALKFISLRAYQPNGPFSVGVSIDKSNKTDHFIANWNVELKQEATFPSCFEVIGSVNPYHRQKATSVVAGFDYLLERILIGFDILADNT